MSSLDYRQFPKNGSLDAQIEFILRYAVRAPSTHNSQPWLFKVEEHEVLLFRDGSRELPEGDKDGRDCYISLGACLEHLTIALHYFRMGGTVTLGAMSDVDAPVATVSVHLSEGNDATLLPMIEAIEKRFNARGPFLPHAVPAPLLVTLAALREEGVELWTSTDKNNIATLAALTSEGMHEVHARKPFRAELSQWMMSNYSSRKDGIPGYTMLAPGPLSLVLPWIIKTFNMSPVLAALNKKAITSAPAIGVITSETDTPASWVKTGMLFARTSLTLNTYGIMTSIFVASVEVPRLRNTLAEVFPLHGLPQFTFAFGEPKIQLRQSPRHDPASRMIQ